MYDTLFNNALYGNYRTRTFTDIYPSQEEFSEAYSSSGLAGAISDTSVKTLYYLLYARYGNSHISSSDETRFQYDLYGIIFSYGPTWEKRLAVQKQLRELDDDDLMYGAKAIYNTALNPSTGPTVNSDGTPAELNYINSQNTTNYKKSKLEAYSMLYGLLETDVTTEFINRFERLFNPWGSELPLYYVSEGDEE